MLQGEPAWIMGAATLASVDDATPAYAFDL
jgi:hypothetical protein